MCLWSGCKESGVSIEDMTFIDEGFVCGVIPCSEPTWVWQTHRVQGAAQADWQLKKRPKVSLLKMGPRMHPRIIGNGK